MADNEIEILIKNLDANDFNLLIDEMHQNDSYCCGDTNPEIWNFANTLSEYDLEDEEGLNEAKKLLIDFIFYNDYEIDDLEDFNNKFNEIFETLYRIIENRFEDE